jgi:hypothetical protein
MPDGRRQKKPEPPSEFYQFWEPGTGAVQIVGRLLRKWRTNMLVESVAMYWGDKWIRVSKIKMRIPIASAVRLEKPPQIHVEYVVRPK